MYMLPFFFTYMFLMNGGSLVWSESLLIALVVLFHFDTRVAALLYVAGTSLACAAYAASAEGAQQLPPELQLYDQPHAGGAADAFHREGGFAAVFI